MIVASKDKDLEANKNTIDSLKDKVLALENDCKILKEKTRQIVPNNPPKEIEEKGSIYSSDTEDIY